MMNDEIALCTRDHTTTNTDEAKPELTQLLVHVRSEATEKFAPFKSSDSEAWEPRFDSESAKKEFKDYATPQGT